MKLASTVKSLFARKERNEIVVPSGPHLTITQSICDLREKIMRLDTDRRRLDRVKELSFGKVPVRYRSAYYRCDWTVYGPEEADMHIRITEQLRYEHYSELNAIEPHPDFDLMHPDPARRQHLASA